MSSPRQVAGRQYQTKLLCFHGARSAICFDASKNAYQAAVPYRERVTMARMLRAPGPPPPNGL